MDCAQGVARAEGGEAVSLAKYLAARHGRTTGWVEDYEASLTTGWVEDYEASLTSSGERPSWPWLAGHYEGMLGALIDLIGHDVVETLVAAHVAVAARRIAAHDDLCARLEIEEKK
jgi:hypothetical protein